MCRSTRKERITRVSESGLILVSPPVQAFFFMKHIFFTLCIGLAITGYSQDTTSCCTIIGINPGTNSVTARNNTSGQLFTFRAEPADIANLKLNDAVTTNESFTYVTAINNIRKQYFAGPVNLMQVKSADASGLVMLKYEEPCCRIVTIENAEPCCSRISAQQTSSGNIFQFIVPKALASTIKTGDAVYSETISSGPHAIVQTMYNSNTGASNVFAFPVEQPGTLSGGLILNDNWVMIPVTGMDGNFGRLNTTFPDDVEWGIDIYTRPDRKLMMNRNPKEKQNYYDMEPGNYDFKLNNVMVANVPVEKGKETRLKAGYLVIKTDNNWSLTDNIKNSVIYSGYGKKKIALPVGTYQLKQGAEYIPVIIKDGAVTEI